jgi:hypothetical protein
MQARGMVPAKTIEQDGVWSADVGESESESESVGVSVGVSVVERVTICQAHVLSVRYVFWGKGLKQRRGQIRG